MTEQEDRDKAVKQFAEKMEKHLPAGDKHHKLFQRLTWSGTEIDWTRISEFIMFAILMLVIFGIFDYIGIQHDEKILDNQDVIKQNQMLILASQAERKDMLMNIERQHHLVINILLTRTQGCSKCHQLTKDDCGNK